MESINPATEELLKKFEPFSDEEVSQIIEKSHSAFIEWRRLTLTERKIFNIKLKEILEKRKEEIAKLITQEMGNQ